MKTQLCTALYTGAPEDAAAQLTAQLQRQLEGRTPALVLVFAARALPLPALLPALQRAFASTPVLGCTSAGEFAGSAHTHGGASAVALVGDLRVHVGLGRSVAVDPERALREALEGGPSQVEGYPHRTVLMLVDGMAGNPDALMDAASRLLGPSAQLVGGSAGDELGVLSPQVGLGERVEGGAVVLATLFTRQALGIGVQHGHEPLSGALKVTRAHGNQVDTLEGRSAWEVWKEETRAHAAALGLDPERLTDEEASAYLLRYEAGVVLDGELVMRAPMGRLADGALVFASPIPEGATVRITQSDTAAQVASAREAARRARAALGDAPCAGAIVFDCVCRRLFLQEGFAAAVQGMRAELDGAPLAGFETFGEIALQEGGRGAGTGFHNTTTVVLALPA